MHVSALRARFDAHTQVARFEGDGLAWLGALGEDMLVTLDEEPDPGARDACAACYLRGERLWQIVRPGALLVPDTPRAPSSIYGGSDRRPWLVIGESDVGDLLAAPLNDAGNPKWWTPVAPRAALAFPGSVKDAAVELAHVWSLPAALEPLGELTPLGRGAVERAVRAYVAG
ncbi:MAG: hypothetical protein ACNA8N_11485 [Trueperaceae bacterium]